MIYQMEEQVRTKRRKIYVRFPLLANSFIEK
jgi:hypothetical protein